MRTLEKSQPGTENRSGRSRHQHEYGQSWMLASVVTLTGGQRVCVLAGLVLFHHGRMLMHRAGHMLRHSCNHDSRTPAFLLTDGPYARRRHPLATGIILLNAGLGIGLYSVWSLGGILLAGLLQLFQSIREEKHLATRWGREFIDYRHNVPHRFLSAPSWVILLMLYVMALAGL
jgi:protein-S-isoprenylcysteine O-methyltransferase Ste14